MRRILVDCDESIETVGYYLSTSEDAMIVVDKAENPLMVVMTPDQYMDLTGAVNDAEVRKIFGIKDDNDKKDSKKEK